MNTQYENEIPKYFKQKESNISKANKKSKHKHQYEECLIQSYFNSNTKHHLHTSLNSYCTICGKIGGGFKNGECNMEIEKLQKQRQEGKSCYVSISGEELYERYHDRLPVFFVEKIFDEYVDLDKKIICKRE